MSIVICQLPKAGLGNQLFPLLKAAVFARLNDLPLLVTGYHQLKIGPWLRGEKTKRNYHGYFLFEKSMIGEYIDRLKLYQYRKYDLVKEPVVKKLEGGSKEKRQFVFSEIPHWSDYFAGLKEHRSLAISLFHELINPAVIRSTIRGHRPSVGVHIRMGDFRKLKAGENFASVGAVRTPEIYFVDIIKAIREILGLPLPVTVFTDGYRSEFETLFTMQDVHLEEGNKDIEDLLLLSQSQFIVASAGSTFSYWAGFLSNSPLILHPDHLHASIRPEEVNRLVYEGPFDLQAQNGLLRRNIITLI